MSLDRFIPAVDHGLTVSVSTANVRVMSLHANRTTALVGLHGTIAAAIRQAEIVFRHHQALAMRDPISYRSAEDCLVRVFVQRWHGSLTEGVWSTVPNRHDGFDKAISFKRPSKRSSQDLLEHQWRTGEKVECVLLEKRTRRGGWRAKMLNAPYQGPITNSDIVPATVSAGEQVELRICSLSTRTSDAQFAWAV